MKFGRKVINHSLDILTIPFRAFKWLSFDHIITGKEKWYIIFESESSRFCRCYKSVCLPPLVQIFTSALYLLLFSVVRKYSMQITSIMNLTKSLYAVVLFRSLYLFVVFDKIKWTHYFRSRALICKERNKSIKIS